MSLVRGIPIVLCGRTEQIGSSVIAGLRPDYEVIHFVLSPEAGVNELPLVLQGITPNSTSSRLGSGDFAHRAKAVIFGGGYGSSDIDTVCRAVSRAAIDSKTPWLRQDKTKSAPPPGPEYGTAIVARVKEALEGLAKEGKLDGSDGGVYWY